MFFKFLTSKHGKFGIVSNKIVVIKKLKNSLKNTKYLCIFLDFILAWVDQKGVQLYQPFLINICTPPVQLATTIQKF